MNNCHIGKPQAGTRHRIGKITEKKKETGRGNMDGLELMEMAGWFH